MADNRRPASSRFGTSWIARGRSSKGVVHDQKAQESNIKQIQKEQGLQGSTIEGVVNLQNSQAYLELCTVTLI